MNEFYQPYDPSTWGGYDDPTIFDEDNNVIGYADVGDDLGGDGDPFDESLDEFNETYQGSLSPEERYTESVKTELLALKPQIVKGYLE
jgi:hypothetical protein